MLITCVLSGHLATRTSLRTIFPIVGSAVMGLGREVSSLGPHPAASPRFG